MHVFCDISSDTGPCCKDSPISMCNSGAVDPLYNGHWHPKLGTPDAACYTCALAVYKAASELRTLPLEGTACCPATLICVWNCPWIRDTLVWRTDSLLLWVGDVTIERFHCIHMYVSPEQTAPLSCRHTTFALTNPSLHLCVWQSNQGWRKNSVMVANWSHNWLVLSWRSTS